jgi:hypothetical protein
VGRVSGVEDSLALVADRWSLTEVDLKWNLRNHIFGKPLLTFSDAPTVVLSENYQFLSQSDWYNFAVLA